MALRQMKGSTRVQRWGNMAGKNGRTPALLSSLSRDACQSKARAGNRGMERWRVKEMEIASRRAQSSGVWQRKEEGKSKRESEFPECAMLRNREEMEE